MIIVLDLDETLVHSVENELPELENFQFEQYFVHKRPYLDEFLAWILTNPDYEVYIWSAGTYDYVHHIVNTIVPPELRVGVVDILTRGDCNENRDKPLFKVTNNQTNDCLIIDNKPHVTCFNCLNHLIINDFEGDPEDEELLFLMTFLSENKDMPAEWLAINWS